MTLLQSSATLEQFFGGPFTMMEKWAEDMYFPHEHDLSSNLPTTGNDRENKEIPNQPYGKPFQIKLS